MTDGVAVTADGRVMPAAEPDVAALSAGLGAALRAAGLPAGSRIVLEKPFGEDLDSAVSLNQVLGQGMSEQEVFRVDHFLAMTTVQNLLGFRLANRILEPIWNSMHIAEVVHLALKSLSRDCPPGLRWLLTGEPHFRA